MYICTTMNKSFLLNDKRVLITGASSGIGRQCAIDASQLGAQLLITGRDTSRLQQTFELLSGSGHEQMPGDLTDAGFVESLVASSGKLDGLVHSAGILFLHPIRFVTTDEIDRMFKINYNAPVLLTSLLLAKKKMNAGASVVFLSSVGGTQKAFYGGALYGSTKAALESFSKTLALEQSSKGIRSNCIAAGLIKTAISEQYMGGDASSEMNAAYAKQYPLGFGEAEDASNAVCYLLSDAARWVTGSVMTLDGGYTIS